MSEANFKPTAFEKALTTLIFNREGYIHLLGRPEEEYESDLAWIQTLDIAIDSMQKQVAKKIRDKSSYTIGYMLYECLCGFCPICNSYLEDEENYCPECGQKLDWSDSK